MDASISLLHSLNKSQQEAVSIPQGHCLVLAGAGSGKTRVLTHRVAWLVKNQNISPSTFLVVTFTNKAAGEMQKRIESLLNQSTKFLWIGTFHSLAYRFLRIHYQEAKLPKEFQILDSEDQLRLIRQTLKNHNLVDETKWPPRKIQWFINHHKDKGEYPQHIPDDGNPDIQKMVQIYLEYQNYCERNGLVDFTELLLRSYKLWQYYPELLRHYQTRFTHIFVDEFQDTNAIQYEWLRLLIGRQGTLFAVGDDDQAIYGWRGARVENIQQLTLDFPSIHTIRLEQNYRSTSTILAAANAVISCNKARLGKNLWTEGKKGIPIQIYSGSNEQEEAHFCLIQILNWRNQGGSYADIALLYRTNAQSRIFEDILFQHKIPYRIHGGLRFFERAEIKNILAYLRLFIQRESDPVFERIINMPPRGIGAQTLSQIREYAQDQTISLWQATTQLLAQKAFTPRSTQALNNFCQFIQDIEIVFQSSSLPQFTEYVLKKSGLVTHYEKDKSERGQARLDNLKELIQAIAQFQPEDQNLERLSAFLAYTTLGEADPQQAQQTNTYVQLMTLHAAKGLEFPLVFIVGMEEGLFPSAQSFSSSNKLEEERRLCYVGMTRAKSQLYLTYVNCRRLYGSENYPEPSRFITEIPNQLTQELGMHQIQTSQPASSKEILLKNIQLRKGQRVYHPKFGEGILLAIIGERETAEVEVKFYSFGIKRLALIYAKLRPI
ncbi:DNA helicase II [Candidatus Nitrosacidococcus tergens]|uniref:DNA 3'-5' helicase n=1 Tax=Candidatus Nitrosacidococcus tergens TaxID=553981 RepID=A0A7G1QBS5_9GAMM|nr:DNA helicase II [Candidatus Nitrosacidococcus tergens]CAB1277413.1 DNA-dependent ATPase I and helicase II [Candidatus Nitrosacidococcus tergens]